MSEITVTGFGKLHVTEHQNSVNNPVSFFFLYKSYYRYNGGRVSTFCG